METTMLALVLCLVMPYFPAEPKTITLSLMENSVDDMYNGCSVEMGEKVQKEYFNREKNSDEAFKEAWENAESCANDKYNEIKDKKLTKNQVQALVAYTAAFPPGDNFYKHFNAAVRDGADSYTTGAFKYHALHYWLTTALQTLKTNECRTTYRRSKDTFEGDPNQEIRFGQFASTSPNPALKSFGEKTCFHIETCYGAQIEDYACKPRQKEVLIPPYEKFKITEIAYESYEGLRFCKTIFVLKSTGIESNLNCNAAPK